VIFSPLISFGSAASDFVSSGSQTYPEAHALLGRARPLGVVLAGLLFGALNAGGTVMEAATGVPSDVTNVIEALIVLFVAAPPLIRLLFHLRRGGGAGPQAVASKGWSG